jgi:hypothetical protein
MKKVTRMIKLIATDVDGTLVKDASPEVYPEIIEMVKELRNQGIIVCIASGRQYSSIEKLFKDVKDDLIFIADNGAHVKCRGKDLDIVNMNQEYIEELIKELRTFEGCEIICEGPGITYIESKNEDFINFLKTQYRVDYEQVDDLLDKKDKIIKASIFKRPSIRDIGEGTLVPEWQDRLKVTMAGEDWVDFMDKSVDKGNALKFIQKFYGIKPDETMVFGDNNNDIGMLKCATESYAVATAPDVVKEAANHVCPSWKEKGVYQVLASHFLDK